MFLATVLFLVGISGHFRVRQARLGLSPWGALLVFAVIQLLGLPGPPGSPTSSAGSPIRVMRALVAHL